MTGKLILIRHQESEWNKLGRWTGHRDIHLTPLGFERSNKFGSYVKKMFTLRQHFLKQCCLNHSLTPGNEFYYFKINYLFNQKLIST